MPLTLNIGLSKKTSENYNSWGRSINLTAELDSALLASPQELQKRIDALYAQAQEALDHQDARCAPRSKPNPCQTHSRAPSNEPPMTNSQQHAINAIASNLGIDAASECQDILHLQLRSLSIRDASQLIDHLKSLQPKGDTR